MAAVVQPDRRPHRLPRPPLPQRSKRNLVLVSPPHGPVTIFTRPPSHGVLPKLRPRLLCSRRRLLMRRLLATSGYRNGNMTSASPCSARWPSLEALWLSPWPSIRQQRQQASRLLWPRPRSVPLKIRPYQWPAKGARVSTCPVSFPTSSSRIRTVRYRCESCIAAIPRGAGSVASQCYWGKPLATS